MSGRTLPLATAEMDVDPLLVTLLPESVEMAASIY